MKQEQSLKTVFSITASEYLSLYREGRRFREVVTNVNLRRMPLLLIYLTIAFMMNLIFNAWLGDSPIALHDGVFSCVTLVYWILFIACYLNGIQNEKARRWIYGTFWIVCNIYLLIFIGMDILVRQTVYNYLLGMFIIASVPLLTPMQSLITISANMAFGIILSNSSGNGYMLIDFIIGSSLFAAVISIRGYFSFLQIQLVHNRLKELGERDRLTGLYNRNVLDTYVADLWHECIQECRLFTAAMVDIDYFKNYNDTYGHSMGDECLKKVAGCIARAASAELTMRYGGEEFLVFFEAKEPEYVQSVLKDIQKCITKLDLDSGSGAEYPKVTVSVGTAWTIPAEDFQIDALINEADQQLYLAKKSGRNCICGIER